METENSKTITLTVDTGLLEVIKAYSDYTRLPALYMISNKLRKFLKDEYSRVNALKEDDVLDKTYTNYDGEQEPYDYLNNPAKAEEFLRVYEEHNDLFNGYDL